MPAWGASHDDEDLWPVVAFMTVLPKLSADAYQSMLASAAGSGHHAADDVSHSHSDAAIESSGHHDGVQSHQDQSSNREVIEHSHSADSHGNNESAGEKKNSTTRARPWWWRPRALAVKGNPLEDISLLENVEVVVKGGLVFKAPVDL